MLIMHMNIDIDPKGNEDVSLHHCFSVVSWILKCSCLLLPCFWTCFSMWVDKLDSKKTSWRLACRSQAHSILQEHITLARNLFVNPQVIIRHWPDSINWAFLDFLKRPIILTQLHSTSLNLTFNPFDSGYPMSPRTLTRSCHMFIARLERPSPLTAWDLIPASTPWQRRDYTGGSWRLETFLIQQWMQMWNGHGKDMGNQSALGTWYCLDIRSCFELFSRHGSTHWFLSIHFRPLEGGVSLNPINIAKPHRINQKHLFDQQLPCKSQTHQVRQDVDQLKFDVGELKDLLTNSKGRFAAPCEVSQGC